jgi:hypothetical protein
VNPRRRTAKASVVVTAAVLALGLSSCGFNAPTDQIYNPPIGVNETGGNVDVLNAVIVSGSNGSGSLIATLVNENPKRDDTLTNITGAASDQVTVSPPSRTTIPAGGLLNLADAGGASVTGGAVKAGAFVRLTLSFQHGQSVEIDVPVYPPTGPFANVSPSA